jgi:hypothetical protein
LVLNVEEMVRGLNGLDVSILNRLLRALTDRPFPGTPQDLNLTAPERSCRNLAFSLRDILLLKSHQEWGRGGGTYHMDHDTHPKMQLHRDGVVKESFPPLQGQGALREIERQGMGHLAAGREGQLGEGRDLEIDLFFSGSRSRSRGGRRSPFRFGATEAHGDLSVANIDRLLNLGDIYNPSMMLSRHLTESCCVARHLWEEQQVVRGNRWEGDDGSMVLLSRCRWNRDSGGERRRLLRQRWGHVDWVKDRSHGRTDQGGVGEWEIRRGDWSSCVSRGDWR